MNATPEQLAQLAALVGAKTCFRDKPYPALDTDAGDDVFLARFMRWLMLNDYCPAIEGHYAARRPSAYIHFSYSKQEKGYGKTFTLALITACQSAGVEEIVAIFGEAEK